MTRCRDLAPLFGTLALCVAADAQETPRAAPAAKPIRVLYVEDRPRWEYRYLKNTLLRGGPRLEVQAWLCDATPDFVQEHSDGLAALRSLPRTNDELARYDVVLLGDVPPDRLGQNAEQRRKFARTLARFVEDGGGVGFVAGSLAMPERYRESELSTLFPVELETPVKGATAWVRSRESFRSVVEKPAPALHPLLRFEPDPAATERVLARISGFWGYLKVVRERAGAEVVLSHPTDKNRHGRRPILVVQDRGRGRVLFVATDETWRWRNPHGDRYHGVFWHNVVRYLARREEPEPRRQKKRP